MNQPPRKTELGQLELRQRVRKLGQRHRTLLLLVDGKRSLGEVLGQAQKAGVAVSYFEELVGFGMVDVGGPDSAAGTAPQVPPPDPTESQVAELDALLPAVAAAAVGEPLEPLFVGSAIASLDTDIDIEARGAGEPELVVTETVIDVLPAPAAVMPEATVPALAGTAAASGNMAPPALVDAIAMPAEPVEGGGWKPPPAFAEPPAAAAAAPVFQDAVPLVRLALDSGASMVPVAEPEPAPAMRAAPHADLLAGLDADALPTGDLLQPPGWGPAPDQPATDAPGDGPDARLLAEVRSLLIGSLLIDGPVSGSLSALRVGRARTQEELVRLVWEVERSMVRARRPPEAQRRLTRARDLLGLGNTVVHGDSFTGDERE